MESKGEMSSLVKDMLLKFVVSELAKSNYNHVLQYIDGDEQTSQQKLLVASAFAASLQQTSSKCGGGSSKVLLIESRLCNIFHINSESLELLIQDIGSILRDEKCPHISIQEGILFVTWILCQTEETKPPYELVEPSTSLQYLGKIIKALAALSSDRISWPSYLECNEIAQSFETSYGFPGVVGVLTTYKLPIMLTSSSGCDVGKVQNLEDFYDTALGCPTTALQVVFDHHGSMLDVCVGLPGGWSSDKVLCSSRLYARLVCSKVEDKSLLLPDGLHVLAGPEFPQLPTLITPYDCQVSDSSPVKSCFNRVHGRAFNSGISALSGFLSKFSRLKNLNEDGSWNPMRKEFLLGDDPCHSAALVTLAACVLYNLSLEK